jgi:glycosyltransferase involved in cell wall biosynthesis
MQKVLLVYFEPQSSGQTTHVLSLVKGLNKDKYAITVVLPAQLLHNISAFKQTGVTINPLPMRKILWNPKSIVSLISLIRKQNFDIVHVHSQEAGFIVRLIARAAGAKLIIYTPQCTNIRRTRWFWLYRSIERILSYITDMIVSVSEIDRSRIIQWGIPSSKVITINNGIDIDFTKSPPDLAKMRKMLGLDEKQPIVMQVGRLSYQKNPLAFIKGASIVIKELPDVQFLLVGDGPLKDEVEGYIQELGINKNVHCLGRQDNANEFIAIADIITLTSRWEGLPYVLLEAMAWSCPVVTTAVNGCPEIVKHGDTGYLVPVNDARTWAKYVIKLLEETKNSGEMGKRGNRMIRDKLTLQKMIENTEQLYDRFTLNQLIG